MSTVKRTEIREERRVFSNDGSSSDPFFNDINADNFSRTSLSSPSSGDNNNTTSTKTTRTTTTTTSGSGTTTSSDQDTSSNDQKTPGKFSEVIALGGNVEPEDLSVTLKDNIMTIEAKISKEKKSEEGNLTSTSKIYRQITQSFNIPSNVDQTQLKTVLTPEGNLKIEAPYQQKALPPPPPAPTPKREADVPIKIR